MIPGFGPAVIWIEGEEPVDLVVRGTVATARGDGFVTAGLWIESPDFGLEAEIAASVVAEATRRRVVACHSGRQRCWLCLDWTSGEFRRPWSHEFPFGPQPGGLVSDPLTPAWDAWRTVVRQLFAAPELKRDMLIGTINAVAAVGVGIWPTIMPISYDALVVDDVSGTCVANLGPFWGDDFMALVDSCAGEREGFRKRHLEGRK